MEETINDKVKTVEQQIQDFLKEAQVDELVRDNQVEFTIADVKYRIKKPNFEQKQVLTFERTRKFVELLKSPNQLMEKDLVEVYAQRGIKISDFDDKFTAAQTEINSYRIKLGEALVAEKPKEELDVFKKEIMFLIAKQRALMMEKTIMLEATIETQIYLYVYTYLASMITEKLVGETWQCAWPSYDAFIKEDGELVNKIIYYASLVCKNDVPT